MREPIEAINMHIHYGRLEITEEKDGMYADIHKVRALEKDYIDLERKLKIAEEALEKIAKLKHSIFDAHMLSKTALSAIREE